MEPLNYVAQNMIVVYRNRLDTAAAIVVGLIAAVGFVTVGLATLGAPAWFRVLLPVGGLPYGYLLVFRDGRVGVYKARGAIRVQDWFRSHDLFWPEIQRFELEQRFDWGGNRKLGFVVLKDGSRIGLPGMTTPKLIAALNDALSRSDPMTNPLR